MAAGSLTAERDYIGHRIPNSPQQIRESEYWPVYKFIRDNPGSDTSTISKATGVPNNGLLTNKINTLTWALPRSMGLLYEEDGHYFIDDL